MKAGAIFLTGVFISVVMWLAGAQALSSHVLITQLQLGGNGNGTASQEYIEITNVGSEDLDITGWCLHYASATSSSLGSELACIETDSQHVRLLLPAGASMTTATPEFITAHPAIIPEKNFMAGLSGSGGHVTLVDSAGNVIDKVGWGTAKFAETAPALVPAAGLTLQRQYAENLYVDTNNNQQDFISAPLVEPGVSALYEVIDQCLNNDEFPGFQEVVPDGYEQTSDGACVLVPPEPKCEGVKITEILPNPAGVDEGKEYIELYNASDAEVLLQNCVLFVDDKPITSDQTIPPGHYLAVHNVTLPNTAGGTVTLVISGTEYSVTYPQAMKDDEAWALFDEEWADTNQPTPGDKNKLNRIEKPNDTDSPATLTPCAPGKERNPATNRCRNIVSAVSSLQDCAPGQYRNPETNRCRKITTASTALKPCGPGESRNPATNRCRKVAAAENLLKPCDEGEERNPETNRCRKITGVAGAATVLNPEVTTAPHNYRVLGVALLMAIGYGLYEYRQDISQKFAGLRQKILRR